MPAAGSPLVNAHSAGDCAGAQHSPPRGVKKVGAGGFLLTFRFTRAVLISTGTPFALKTPDNPDGVDRAILDKSRASWVMDFPKWLGENARPFFVPETSPEMMQWVIGEGKCSRLSPGAVLSAAVLGKTEQ